MLRLSQRGWNNVIIFAMLFMILLFNSTNNLLIDNAENSAEQYLLPEGVPVMVLDFGQQKVERIGRGWRSNPGLSAEEDQLAQFVEHWQQARGAKIPELTLSNPYIVVISLAGEQQGRVFKLQPQGQDLLVSSTEGVFILVNSELAHFIPQELL